MVLCIYGDDGFMFLLLLVCICWVLNVFVGLYFFILLYIFSVFMFADLPVCMHN